jgi:hypothetical protein
LATDSAAAAAKAVIGTVAGAGIGALSRSGTCIVESRSVSGRSRLHTTASACSFNLKLHEA